jgi:hypothetical protein
MIEDARGDMGFMEAIVSLMAVTIVIGLYLAFVATSAAAAYDPMERFDIDSLDVDISDGVSIDVSYLYACIAANDIAGISVTVTVPGFLEDVAEFRVGNVAGLEHSRTFLRVLPFDNGRNIPVVVEVVSFVRAGRDSQRSWTPCSSWS